MLGRFSKSNLGALLSRCKLFKPRILKYKSSLESIWSFCGWCSCQSGCFLHYLSSLS